MHYSFEQRVFIVEEYVKSKSIQFVRDSFSLRFPKFGVPAKSTIQDLIKKWRLTGSVSDGKKHRKPTVRTPEAVADIAARIGRSPNQSTRRLAQQCGISRRSCQRVLHGLNMKPFRVSVVHQIQAIQNVIETIGPPYL